jgi:hypothetical protein
MQATYETVRCDGAWERKGGLFCDSFRFSWRREFSAQSSSLTRSKEDAGERWRGTSL